MAYHYCQRGPLPQHDRRQSVDKASKSLTSVGDGDRKFVRLIFGMGSGMSEKVSPKPD
jgi:hypothetical protein